MKLLVDWFNDKDAELLIQFLDIFFHVKVVLCIVTFISGLFGTKSIFLQPQSESHGHGEKYSIFDMYCFHNVEQWFCSMFITHEPSNIS